MKRIPLSNGGYALVDDEDYDRLKGYAWRRHYFGYVTRGARVNGKKLTIRMHREIIDIQPGYECDHIDGNRQNNQRSNLRQVTHQQNMYNRGCFNGRHSKYKGVSKRRDRWKACIMQNYNHIHIGYFATEEEAALAYNAKAKELFGEYARLNVIKKKNRPLARTAGEQITLFPILSRKGNP